MYGFFRKVFGSVFAVLTLSCGGAVGAPPSTQAASATRYSGPCIMSPIPPDAPLYHVTGRVIDDASGLPVAGAKVSLDSLCGVSGTTGRRQEDHFHLQIVTDEEGKFAFDKIPVMTVSLSATRDNYLQTFAFRRKANDPIGSFMVGPNTDPITLRIAPAASISGIVRDQDGAPMPDAWITLQCFHTWQSRFSGNLVYRPLDRLQKP